MSLSLLKAELDAATKELKTTVKGEEDDFQMGSVKSAKKRKKEVKGDHGSRKRGVNFQFAPDYVGKEDRTAECLAALEMLDRGSKVKAAGLHSPVDRRGGEGVGKKKKEEEGTLFTEEDFANFEKDLFLHSNPKKMMKKGDD